MNKQKIMRFYSFFLGCIYMSILILLEFLGIGLFRSLTKMHMAGLRISCAKLISLNGITFFRDVYLPLLSNTFGFFSIGLLLSTKTSSNRVNLSIIVLVVLMLGVDSYVFSYGAFYYVILGFSFHVYFLYVLMKGKFWKSA